MATWKGDPKKFKVEFLPKDFDKYFYDTKCDEVEFRWEYQTTADILTIYAEHPDMETPHKELLGPDWAEAQLYTLANYYKTYVGQEQLKELLKDLLEE